MTTGISQKISYTNNLICLKVYHSIINRVQPWAVMSPRLKKLVKRLPHPGVWSICVILWVTPHMTLDRWLVATVFSWYLCFGTRVTHNDYEYTESQVTVTKHKATSERTMHSEYWPSFSLFESGVSIWHRIWTKKKIWLFSHLKFYTNIILYNKYATILYLKYIKYINQPIAIKQVYSRWWIQHQSPAFISLSSGNFSTSHLYYFE